MEQHPIESVMRQALESIRTMVDVDTVIGNPVITPHGQTVIPLSRVTFGFAAGGGEYGTEGGTDLRKPFAGGSGAGVSITPVGFLVVEQDTVHILRTDGATPLERVTELAPKVLEEITALIRGCGKEEEIDTAE